MRQTNNERQLLTNQRDKYYRTSRKRPDPKIIVALNGDLTLIGNAALRLYSYLQFYENSSHLTIAQIRQMPSQHVPKRDLTSILRHLEPTRNAWREVAVILQGIARLEGSRIRSKPGLTRKIQLVRK